MTKSALKFTTTMIGNMIGNTGPDHALHPTNDNTLIGNTILDRTPHLPNGINL
jgi:hypothetical protein